MPRVTYTGDAEDAAIPGGPLFACGESKDLSEAEAAPYRHSNVFTVTGGPAPQPQAQPEPEQPTEGAV